MNITLVVPVYNAEDTLDGLFDSIMQQSHRFDQVVFVDNGSEDRSLGKLRSFRLGIQQTEVQVISETARGPGCSRNRALQVCRGDIVAFTDSDCRLHQDWARYVVAFFEQDSTVGLLGGVEVPGSTRTLAEKYSAFVMTMGRRPGPIRIVSKFDWFDGHLVSTLNLAVRKQALAALGGFAAWRAGEDIDFWIRALDLGFQIQAHDPNMIVWHRPRCSMGSFARQQWEYGLAVPCLLERHFRGAMLVTTSRKRLLKSGLFTSLIEINAHTTTFLLLLILGWKAIAAYPLFLALTVLRFFFSSRRTDLPLTPWECIKMTVPFEVFRWTVSAASTVGSLTHRVLCIR